MLGVLVGVVNGIITVRFRVPSLITTVGTLFLLQGIVVWIDDSQPIVAPVEEPFNAIFGREFVWPFGYSLFLVACDHGVYAVPLDRARPVAATRTGL